MTTTIWILLGAALVAVLLSVFALGEPMTLYGLIGTVLIIGSAMISELWEPPGRKEEAS